MSTVQIRPAALIRGTKRIVMLIIAVWFTAVAVMGSSDAFSGPPGRPPIPILIGCVLPLSAFFLALRFSSSFRQFVLSFDLRVITAAQGWRTVGLAFLALYAHHVLPGEFAWPAGIGDMIVGFTAPWVVSQLISQPDFAATRTFWAWNIFGILDLVDAIGTGALNSALAGPGQVSSSPMAQIPLLFIPAFLVPIMLMLHIVALMKRRQGRQLQRHLQVAAA